MSSSLNHPVAACVSCCLAHSCSFCLGRGTDPAARTALEEFLFGPLTTSQAAYSISAAQVSLVQGYLTYLTTAYVASTFQQSVLGTFLGARSGGLVVARSVEDWLTGVRHLAWALRVPSDLHVI